MFGKIKAVRFSLCAFLATVPLIALGTEHESGATDGRELYVDFQCWQCHGYEGQGGAAPRLRQSAYPYEAFVRFVRFPNVMPAYPSELLADADLCRPSTLTCSPCQSRRPSTTYLRSGTSKALAKLRSDR